MNKDMAIRQIIRKILNEEESKLKLRSARGYGASHPYTTKTTGKKLGPDEKPKPKKKSKTKVKVSKAFLKSDEEEDK